MTLKKCYLSASLRLGFPDDEAATISVFPLIVISCAQQIVAIERVYCYLKRAEY